VLPASVGQHPLILREARNTEGVGVTHASYSNGRYGRELYHAPRWFAPSNRLLGRQVLIPYRIFYGADVNVDIATPGGVPAPVDSLSLDPQYHGGDPVKAPRSPRRALRCDPETGGDLFHTESAGSWALFSMAA
jgi:hypothetical protein